MTDDVYDKLDEYAEYSDRTKMAEMLNHVITIKEAKYHQFKNRDGEDDDCYIGIVEMDGEEHEAWLDGAVVKTQIAGLIRDERLPLSVKVIRNAEKKGNPYQLVRPDGVESPAPQPQKTRFDAPQWWVPGLQEACSAWLKHNGGFTGVSERIFADGVPADILTLLKIDKETNQVTGFLMRGKSAKEQNDFIAALKADMEQPQTAEELPFA